VDVVFGDVGTVFIEPSGIVVVVGRAPVVVVANISLFVPLMIGYAINNVILEINCTFEPVGLKNSATVSTITAEAALRTLREDDPTLALHHEISARSCNIGD